MAVIARGNVRDRPFARTVYAIAVKRFSGDLILTEGGKQYSVTWKDGAVAAAASASPADSLGRIALTAGLVTTTQLADIMRMAAAAPERPLLDVLREVARLTPEQVVRIKRRALAQCAMRIFALAEASFVLDSAASRPVDPDVAPLHVCWLVYQGLCAHYGEERLERELAAVLGATFQLVDKAEERLGLYGFEAAARPGLGELERLPMSLDELAVVAPQMTRKALLAMIYALVATDAATVVGQVEQAAAPPAARPAPRPEQAASRPEQAASRPEQARVAAAPVAQAAAPVAQPSVAPTSRPRAQPAPRAADPERATEIRVLIAAKLAELDAGADHYELLGVTQDISAAGLRDAYFTLAKRLHPDRLRAAGLGEGAGDAQRLFASINQAYAVLGNAARRAEYDASLRRGGLASGTGDHEAAAAAARILMAEQHFMRGEMALRRGQLAPAVAELEKAVELSPDEAEHHALLAWARWCAADDKNAALSQAKQGLSRAVALSPRCVPAFFYRGQIAASVGELEVAIDCFRKVLELQPEHRDAALQVRLLEGRLSKGEPRKKGGLLDALKRK